MQRKIYTCPASQGWLWCRQGIPLQLPESIYTRAAASEGRMRFTDILTLSEGHALRMRHGNRYRYREIYMEGTVTG